MARSGPGRGGVDRGRGDAALTWGAETQGHAEAMELLPSARVLDPEALHLFGVGATAPEVLPEHGGAGRLEITTSSGQSSTRRRLSPRHRRAVRTFFSPGTTSGTGKR